jgi:hypothetical protein
VYSIFLMYNNTSRISINFFFLQQQYENIARYMSRDVRKASFVLAAAETPAAHGAGYDTVRSIMLWQAAGPFTQYIIRSGRLLEGTGEMAYTTGDGVVELATEGSYFVLDPQRKKVRLHLALRKNQWNTMYSLSPREEMIVCRN